MGTEFAKDRNHSTGSQRHCKACQAEKRRANRADSQEAKDRETMRKRGADGSATYGGSLDKLDEEPYRCHHRILTTRPCRKHATWVTVNGATRYCDEHKAASMSVMFKLTTALLLLATALTAQLPLPVTPPLYFHQEVGVTYPMSSTICVLNQTGTDTTKQQTLRGWVSNTSNLDALHTYIAPNPWRTTYETTAPYTSAQYPVWFIIKLHNYAVPPCSPLTLPVAVPGAAAGHETTWFDPLLGTNYILANPTHMLPGAGIGGSVKYYYWNQSHPIFTYLDVQAMRLDPNDGLFYLSRNLGILSAP